MEHYRRNSTEKRSLNILVAEDNGTNRLIISKILERADNTVDMVENGEQALDKIENRPYDLLILDMQMPILGGLDVIKIHRATAAGPRIPIIILTATATVEARLECEEAGADAFLTKPVNAIKLLDTVAQLTFHNEPVAVKANPVLDSTLAETEEVALLNLRTLHHLNLLGEGSKEFMQSIIHGFISEGEQLVAAMHTALAKSEYVTFKELAHTLKGSAGNVGAEPLFKLCREISQRNLAELQSDAPELLRLTQNSFNVTRQALLSYLENPSIQTG
jgi:two-component system sensor histidine kinase RpfC